MLIAVPGGKPHTDQADPFWYSSTGRWQRSLPVLARDPLLRELVRPLCVLMRVDLTVGEMLQTKGLVLMSC